MKRNNCRPAIITVGESQVHGYRGLLDILIYLKAFHFSLLQAISTFSFVDSGGNVLAEFAPEGLSSFKLTFTAT